MDRLDYDLCSVQEARVLLENGREAQRELITFSQEKLNAIVEAMVEAAYLHAKELLVKMYRKRLSTSVFRLAL